MMWTPRPSRIQIVRCARAATSKPCVIKTRVNSRSPRIRSNKSSTPAPATESRLPVGSSANSSRGSFASERAIATRCRSPTESFDGRCFSRCDRVPPATRVPRPCELARGDEVSPRTWESGRFRPPSASAAGGMTETQSRASGAKVVQIDQRRKRPAVKVNFSARRAVEGTHQVQ